MLFFSTPEQNETVLLSSIRERNSHKFDKICYINIFLSMVPSRRLDLGTRAAAKVHCLRQTTPQKVNDLRLCSRSK